MAIIRHRQGYVDINANPPPRNESPIYEHDQTVENDPRLGLPQHGNTSRINLRTLYDAWNAAYRGLVPHGINPLPITPDAAAAPAPNEFGAEMDDNPKTFDEATPETVADSGPLENDIERLYAVPVSVVDDQTVSEDYFHTYRVNVGAVSTQMIVAQQKFRTSVTLVNLGNQTVWVAETESRLLDGFPLYPATAPATPERYPFPTSREIWAIADPAAAGALMSVAVLITYNRRDLK